MARRNTRKPFVLTTLHICQGFKTTVTPVNSHISSETNPWVVILPSKNLWSQLSRMSAAFHFHVEKEKKKVYK